MRVISFSLVGAIGCGVLALVAGGCGASVEAVCEKVCECEGCNDEKLEECVDQVSDLEAAADDRGCSSEFDDYLSCTDEELECKNGNSSVDGCGTSFEALAKCAAGGLDDVDDNPQPGEDAETGGGDETGN